MLRVCGVRAIGVSGRLAAHPSLRHLVGGCTYEWGTQLMNAGGGRVGRDEVVVMRWCL